MPVAEDCCLQMALRRKASRNDCAPDALNSLQFAGRNLQRVLKGLRGKWGGRACGAAARDWRSGGHGSGAGLVRLPVCGLLSTSELAWRRQRKKARYQDNRDLPGGAFVVVGDVSGVAQAFGQEDDFTWLTLTRLTEQAHGAFRVLGTTSVLAHSTEPSDCKHPAFPTARQSSRLTT